MFGVWLLLVLGAENASAQSPTPPEPITSSAPEYPRRARELGITGKAEFRAEIDEKGRVRSVEILNVPAEDVGFEGAVEKAVEKWTFAAAHTDGAPVPASYDGSLRFSLRADDEDAIHRLVSDATAKDAELLRTRLRVRGEWVDENSLLGDWLKENTEPDVQVNPVILIDSITFPPAMPNSASVSATRYLPGGIEEEIALRATKRSSGWFLVWVGLMWDTEPVLLHNPPDPDFPERARETRMGGSVHVLIVVTIEGQTQILDVLTPLPDGLTEASRQNVLQWRWEPALRQGEPVEAVGIISVLYQMQ